MCKNKQGKVSISPGNIKLGNIASVSLPAYLTCRHCGCWKICYAEKIARLRPSVREAYQRNLRVLQDDPDSFWREVNAQIAVSKFFRFHVSGDIPSAEYLEQMVRAAINYPDCQILCFTKKYELVNEYIYAHKDLPSNLHMIFSGWPGLDMDNPFNLPEAHVYFKDGTTTARPDAKKCGGNCTECAITEDGCWTLKRGEQVVFNQH